MSEEQKPTPPEKAPSAGWFLLIVVGFILGMIVLGSIVR